MHRTSRANRVPQPHIWGLFIALLLPFGALSAAAQEQLPPPSAATGGQPLPPAARTEIIGTHQTRKLGMTSKAAIVDIQNENPTVIKIDKVDRDPTAVFITGVNRGVTRLVFTDVNKKVEELIIRVDDSEQRRLDLLELIHKIAPTAAVTVTVAPNNSVILTGYITDVDTGQRVLEAARAVFTIREGQTNIPATVFNGMTVGGVQTVQLEVVMAVVNRSRLRTMAVSWSYQDPHVVFNSILQGASTFGSGPVNGLASSVAPAHLANAAAAAGALNGTQNLIFGFLGNTAAFQSYITALNTEGLAKILADTRLVTLSGRPASMVSGGETPILVSGGVGQSSVSYKQFGTVVTFLPIVQNGKIHLEVRPELSALNAANSILIAGVTPTSIPGFSIRQAQCAVQLEDGQTLAIGGLIQNTVNATITRVPVLGDIPFLDVLFTNKSYNEVEEELLILVTPRLVDGISCNQIPKFLPGRETRSPDDFELFLEGIMEAPRGPRHLSINPLEYRGAHMQSPNAGSIPCAPTPRIVHSVMDTVGNIGGAVGGVVGGGINGNGGCATGQCGAPAPVIPPTTPPATPVTPVPVPAPGARGTVLISNPAVTDIAPVRVPQPAPMGMPMPAANAIPTSNLPPVQDRAPAAMPVAPMWGDDR
jgi:pilus assembly protein CpaC